ncbi:MAG: hypothetical protein OEW06_05530, partial [Gemmatimonadota bacterium]|nr:hypothetical protein [Gemmatimonadota bacterium]
LAASLPDEYARLEAQVAAALFEHYEPGREAWQSGAMAGMIESYPEIPRAEDVWAHVHSVLVDIDPSRRAFPVEVRLNVTWDEEHTLGVRLKDGRLVELCGSTGP